MGYGLEVDMIAEAHKLDMLTCPYVFDEEQAAAMTKAGADIIVAHMGLTTGAPSAQKPHALSRIAQRSSKAS